MRTFRAADGASLAFTSRRAGHRRAILVTPGIFMHRESPEHRLLAEALLDLADVVTFDVRGHGDSGGRFTWGRREPEDVAALAETLRAEYSVLGGLGFSYGGYHTAIAAATRDVFDAVALVAAPQTLFVIDHNPFIQGLSRSLPIMLRRQRRSTRVSVVPPRVRRSPLELIERIAPPLLILHGSDDWLIPVKHAHRLYERASDPKELHVIPGGLHAENILVDDPDSLLKPLRAFFDRALR